MSFLFKAIIWIVSAVLFFSSTLNANADTELEGKFQVQILDHIRRGSEEALFFRPEKDKRQFKVRLSKKAQQHFNENRDAFTRGSKKVRIQATRSRFRRGVKGTPTAQYVPEDLEVATIAPDDTGGLQPLSLTNPIGTRRVAAVVVDIYTGGTTYRSSTTREAIPSLLFSGNPSLNAALTEISYGLVNLTGDVFGPITIATSDKNCLNYWTWRQTVLQTLTSIGISLDGYDNVIFFFPSYTALGCPFGGVADNPGREAFMFTNQLNGIIHEVGHTFGLGHASTDPENDGVINIEYGDWSCAMGNPYYVTAYNGPHKMQLGWLHALNNQVVELSTPGTQEITISALEFSPVTITTPQLIKVFGPVPDLPYYLSFRKQLGAYSNLAGNGVPSDRVYLHRYGSGTTNTKFITTLASGGSFYDRYIGARMTVTSISGNTARIRVEIGEGDYDHDGVGNNSDPDDDNDSTPDTSDCAPNDNTKWRNRAYRDPDADGIRDQVELGYPSCFGTYPPLRDRYPVFWTAS